MKVSIPEPVAAGAIKALEELNHPDVRHLVREMRAVVDSRTNSDLLGSEELNAVLVAIDQALVSGQGDTERSEMAAWGHLVPIEDRKALLRAARPKMLKLRDRQALRERGL